MAFHGTTTVCSAVGALTPHLFVAITLRVYVPGGAAALSVREDVEKLPASAPLAFTK